MTLIKTKCGMCCHFHTCNTGVKNSENCPHFMKWKYIDKVTKKSKETK